VATEEWKSYTLSSGVEVRYGPFVNNLYWELTDHALELHPDPDPPMKEIETFDGKETVDNLEDPEYKAALKVAQASRLNHIAEAALEFCVEVVDWEKWKKKIRERIAPKVGDPPEDEDELRVWFLGKYAMRTAKDWNLIKKIMAFSQIEEDDVRKRVEMFRGWRGRPVLELMHPALLRSSGWKYSARYREIEASVSAGCADTWDELPKYKRIDLLARWEIKWRMDAVNAWEANRKAQNG